MAARFNFSKEVLYVFRLLGVLRWTKKCGLQFIEGGIFEYATFLEFYMRISNIGKCLRHVGPVKICRYAAVRLGPSIPLRPSTGPPILENVLQDPLEG